MKRLFSNPATLSIIIFLVVLLEYYTITAIRLATKNLDRPFRFSILGLYVIITLFIFWTIFNFRAIDNNEYPSWIKTIASPLMLGFTFAKLLIAVILLGGDIYRVIRWILNLGINRDKSTSSNAIPRSQFLAQAALLTGGIIVSGFAYGIRNKYRYAVKKVQLKLPQENKNLNGMKIVHISDIHAGSFDDKESVLNGIKMIMEQKPDLILFTGDMVNNTQDELIPYKDVFAKLQAPLGVFCVLGNHDYGDYVSWDTPDEKLKNLALLEQHFKDMNWQLLKNEHKIMNFNGEDFALIGVENWSSRGNFPKYGRIVDAVRGLEMHSSMFQILMSHDPSHWDAQIIKDHKPINLTLSGHTHGMQFGINIPQLKWSPVQYMYERWNGLYTQDKQHLYVNPGYGFIGYKGRVGILPEITVIELTA